MSESLEITVQRLLRSSEDVKIAIHARAIPGHEEEQLDPFATHDNGSKHASDTSERENRRIVAVITHLDSSTGDEQGWCVHNLRDYTPGEASSGRLCILTLFVVPYSTLIWRYFAVLLY